MDYTPALIVRVGDRARVVRPPSDGPVVIGRDSEAAIHIPDERISRRHVRLEPPHTGGWLAVDTSTNGIYVNERKRSSVPIADGLALRLGHPPTEGLPVVFELARDGHTHLAPR